MGPKPRAVVTDLDGTVVRWNGTVTAATAAAAAALRRSGVPLVAATARSPAGLRILGPVLEHVAIAVCGNGAVGLRPGPPRQTLWWQAIPETIARRIIGILARELQAAAARAHDGTQWTVTPDYAAVRGTLPTSSPARVAPLSDLIAGDVMMIGVCHPVLDSAQIVAVLAEAGVDPSVATMSFGSGDIMDISAAGVDKAFGVRKALARLGIDPADAVAFGDADNDLPMFAAVGRSVAMGNASPPVLAAATQATASVDDDGFAKALAELGLIG